MCPVTDSLARLSPEQAAYEAAGHPDPETVLTLYDTVAGPERAADARHVLSARHKIKVEAR